WPDRASSHSLTSVSDSGTMKAGLVLRPTISHSAMPAARLSQNGPWRPSHVLWRLIPPPQGEGGRAERGRVGGWDDGSPRAPTRSAFGRPPSRCGGGMESVGRPGIILLAATAVALATPGLRQPLLHHRVGVLPHAAVHQPFVFDRLLAGLNAAGADRHLDHGFELLFVHAVVVGGPEADVEKLL